MLVRAMIRSRQMTITFSMNRRQMHTMIIKRERQQRRIDVKVN